MSLDKKSVIRQIKIGSGFLQVGSGSKIPLKFVVSNFLSIEFLFNKIKICSKIFQIHRIFHQFLSLNIEETKCRL